MKFYVKAYSVGDPETIKVLTRQEADPSLTYVVAVSVAKAIDWLTHPDPDADDLDPGILAWRRRAAHAVLEVAAMNGNQTAMKARVRLMRAEIARESRNNQPRISGQTTAEAERK